LATALAPLRPSPAQRARVLASCRAGPARPHAGGPQRSRRTMRRLPAAWHRVAAAAAVAVLSGVAGAELASTRHEAERERLLSLVETVGAASARAVVLGPGAASPRARARGFLEPESRRIVLFVHGLPPAPSSHSYQLWTLAGERPSSAGTFATTGAGSARHAALAAVALDPATRLAVTLEPTGGSDAPTGPIVLAER
jgi:anti-sigma-K factor RskA